MIKQDYKSGRVQVEGRTFEIEFWTETHDSARSIQKNVISTAEQLHGYCPACKNYTPNHNEGACAECKHEYFQYQNVDARDNWKWRSIKED